MKPFDLEAAKRGEPLITRDRREAFFIAHVPEVQESERLIFRSGEYLIHSHETGMYWSDGDDSSHDIFMAPKKRTVWVNLRNNGYASYWESEEEANSFGGTRIGNCAFPIEIEE